jgi:hypothetical protein
MIIVINILYDLCLYLATCIELQSKTLDRSSLKIRIYYTHGSDADAHDFSQYVKTLVFIFKILAVVGVAHFCFDFIALLTGVGQ